MYTIMLAMVGLKLIFNSSFHHSVLSQFLIMYIYIYLFKYSIGLENDLSEVIQVETVNS